MLIVLIHYESRLLELSRPGESSYRPVIPSISDCSDVIDLAFMANTFFEAEVDHDSEYDGHYFSKIGIG